MVVGKVRPVMFVRFGQSMKIFALCCGLAVAATPVVSLTGCGRGKLATDIKGPAGCGLRDPRETSPNMLSMAQKTYFQKHRAIKDVRKNEHGGLDWIYKLSAGSVFGEQQTLETVSFDKDGLLVGVEKELLRKVGK